MHESARSGPDYIPYPFHKDLWCVDAFFYPAWVPRRIGWNFISTTDVVWNQCQFHKRQSLDGVASADRQKMTYTFPSEEPFPFSSMVLTVEKLLTVNLRKFHRWKIRIDFNQIIFVTTYISSCVSDNPKRYPQILGVDWAEDSNTTAPSPPGPKCPHQFSALTWPQYPSPYPPLPVHYP